jgi:hypothetical protein
LLQSTLQVERTNKQQEADVYLARAFYVAGVAPHVLDNPFMKRALQKVALVGPSYDAPGRRAVMENMLANERRRVSTDISTARAAISSKFGITLVLDGMLFLLYLPVLVY